MTREPLFWKIARLDGWDFYSGDTINYRGSIGGKVSIPKKWLGVKPELCSPSVLHASRTPIQCFAGGSIPCSLFRVTGTPLVEDRCKAGFKELTVLEEVPQESFDELFEFKYSEAVNPVDPCKIKAVVGVEEVALLKKWASVRGSVWGSVWGSVRGSVWGSVRGSVWGSVRASAWGSVRASAWAYVGSLFPNMEAWKDGYPFQSGAQLWRRGLVPSFDGKTWRLHGGEKMAAMYELKEGLKA